MDSSECPDGLGSIRMGDFFVIFESVPDPRDINARHDLREILFIALAAMLCGAESCVEIAQFGIEKTDLLRSILELKHGTPSHDTRSAGCCACSIRLRWRMRLSVSWRRFGGRSVRMWA